MDGKNWNEKLEEKWWREERFKVYWEISRTRMTELGYFLFFCSLSFFYSPFSLILASSLYFYFLFFFRVLCFKNLFIFIISSSSTINNSSPVLKLGILIKGIEREWQKKNYWIFYRGLKKAGGLTAYFYFSIHQQIHPINRRFKF